MKKVLFISVLMTLFCACSNETGFTDESDTPTINKRSELMDPGILTIDFEAGGRTTNSYYYAVVEVKVKMESVDDEIFYPLDKVVTLSGRVGVPSTQLEYSYPISISNDEIFWSASRSADEYDEIEINIGETYSTHCLSSYIGISLSSQ